MMNQIKVEVTKVGKMIGEEKFVRVKIELKKERSMKEQMTMRAALEKTKVEFGFVRC